MTSSSSSPITIDARWIVGGIGTYIRALVEGLSRQKDIPPIRIITRRQHLDLVLPFNSNIALVDVGIYGIREQILVPAAAKNSRLLHVPHFNIPLLYSGQLVVTIHDLILTTVSPNLKSAAAFLYSKPMLWLAARKASHIITVSEYSKQQIVEHLRVDPSRITVIYNIVRPCFRPQNIAESRQIISNLLNLPDNYFLFVSNFKPHKNLNILLQAFALLRSRGQYLDKKLLLVGGTPKNSPGVHSEIQRLGLEKVVLTIPHLSDDILVHAYCAANTLIMPSTSEGFGLPVAEAMACGTPVICSRIPVFEEIAQDAACYFDPASAEDLAETIDKLLACPDQQSTIRSKGLAQVLKFNETEFVNRHLAIYERFS